MKVKVLQMLIKFLSGPKAGTTTHAPTSQNTQLLIDAGLAEQVILSPEDEKRLRFSGTLEKPQTTPKWLADVSQYSGRPQLCLVTPLIKEVVTYGGELDKADEFFKLVCGGAYARFCPIPKDVLKTYAALLKVDSDAWVADSKLQVFDGNYNKAMPRR